MLKNVLINFDNTGAFISLNSKLKCSFHCQLLNLESSRGYNGFIDLPFSTVCWRWLKLAIKVC